MCKEVDYPSDSSAKPQTNDELPAIPTDFPQPVPATDQQKSGSKEELMAPTHHTKLTNKTVPQSKGLPIDDINIDDSD